MKLEKKLLFNAPILYFWIKKNVPVEKNVHKMAILERKICKQTIQCVSREYALKIITHLSIDLTSGSGILTNSGCFYSTKT